MVPAYTEQGIDLSTFSTVNNEVTQPESFHNGWVFRLEYTPQTPDAVLQNDIMTYLEEYRLQVQKGRYELLYTKDTSGQVALRSSDNGDSMVSIGRNAIVDRERNGQSVAKETADLLGMQKIQSFMDTAEEGDTILWASPPDPEVGYEYGFFYIGQVKKINGVEKKLQMAAVRLDNSPTLGQFNSALSHLTQQEIAHTSVNQFISQPQHVKRALSESEVDFVLRGAFDFKRDPQEEQKVHMIKQKLQPYVDVFKRMVQAGMSESQLRKMVFALENYTLQLKSEIFPEEQSQEYVVFQGEESRLMPVEMFVDRFSHAPPKVVGSCDVGSGGSGPNILGYGSIFNPGAAVSGVPGVENCPKISCRKCPWVADDSEVSKIQKGDLTSCPKCGWKPG